MEYNYKIVKTDINFNVMEVEYSSPDSETLLVGMPLPVEGQDYLEIIRSYAPVHHWIRAKQVFVDVPVGTSGTLSAIPEPVAVPPANTAPPELTIDQITQMLTPPPVV